MLHKSFRPRSSDDLRTLVFRAFLFVCCISSMVGSSLGQVPIRAVDKLDPQLKLWVSDPSLFQGDNPTGNTILALKSPTLTPIIFKTTSADPASLVLKHHGTIHSVIGQICTGLMPIDQIIDFASEEDIVRIESSAKVQLCNEKARVLIGANKVNEGKLPNGIPYTGKGVLVGVYDFGLDFTHPDFRLKTDTTQTRIISLWDQTAKTGIKPQPYNYGSEWDATQINAALATPSSISEKDITGHGTHVTGSAAGLRGMAYDADIIFVKTSLPGNSDSSLFSDTKSILDGFNYIYQKAVALDRPCVVNLSIGHNLGSPHDGSSLVEQGFDYLVNSRKGFLICVGNGNTGSTFLHWGGFQLTTDSVWTYAHGLVKAMMYSVFQTANEDSTFVSIVADSLGIDLVNNTVMTQKTIYQTPWVSLMDIRKLTSGMSYTAKYSDSSVAASIQMTASLFDSTRTELRLYMTPKSTSFVPTKATFFRIALKGKGSFDSWSETLGITYSNLSPFTYSQDSSIHLDNRYRKYDNNSSVNILACAKKVFGVGAYVNQVSYIDSSGETQLGANYFSDPTGTLASFSSWGPTTDGRIKPDFCAPGVNVASSNSRSAKPFSGAVIDRYTVVESGTSMASPMAAGAIALYLEKYPNATFDEVYSAITTTTDTDSLTNVFGPLPNSRFGYGRLNIFRAMGGIESSVSGYNRATTPEQMSVFPDPATNEVVFTTKSQSPTKKLTITDLGGKILGVYPFDGSSLKIDVRSWVKGAYFFRVSDGSFGKFIVN